MKVVFLFVLLLSGYCFADEEAVEDSDVVVGTAENFDGIIADNDFVLVEFYAPWCGHCKHLAPEYAQAATTVKDEGIVLVKVDATVHAELASSHGIRGYPTLFFYKNGEKYEFNGPRDAEGIVQWLRKKSGPVAVTLETEADLDAFTGDKSVSVVGFFAAGEEHLYFDAASTPAFDAFSFGLVTSADVAAAAGVELGTVKIFRDFDDDVTSDDLDDITGFIFNNGYPYIDDARSAWGRLRAKPQPVALVVYPTEGEDAAANLAFASEIAKANRDNFGFAYLDSDQFLKNVMDMGVSGERVPTIVVVGLTNLNYPYPDENAYDTESIQAWLDGIVSGDVKPHFKSAPIPESNDGPVTILVGNSFQELVIDSDKNVLVEFYAPWCGHCKQLAPTYEKLGEHFADNDDVVIASLDSTANDNAAVQIQGFPTIYWFGAGNKGEPVEYTGGRDLDSFISFINGQLGIETADEDHSDHGHEHDF
eukprot:TRINITY_DN13930_c0_g1_i1.p1 TRINITY_DN13930_c0_g1~~TRINITY_DN13930_c0_g1_i1.p1  ORF type:complete len:478 (-),score=117.22 TRINITY_DN13930_c0_g1_i1:124-1557(-)